MKRFTTEPTREAPEDAPVLRQGRPEGTRPPGAAATAQGQPDTAGLLPSTSSRDQSRDQQRLPHLSATQSTSGDGQRSARQPTPAGLEDDFNDCELGLSTPLDRDLGVVRSPPGSKASPASPAAQRDRDRDRGDNGVDISASAILLDDVLAPPAAAVLSAPPPLSGLMHSPRQPQPSGVPATDALEDTFPSAEDDGDKSATPKVAAATAGLTATTVPNAAPTRSGDAFNNNVAEADDQSPSQVPTQDQDSKERKGRSSVHFQNDGDAGARDEFRDVSAPILADVPVMLSDPPGPRPALGPRLDHAHDQYDDHTPNPSSHPSSHAPASADRSTTSRPSGGFLLPASMATRSATIVNTADATAPSSARPSRTGTGFLTLTSSVKLETEYDPEEDEDVSEDETHPRRGDAADAHDGTQMLREPSVDRSTVLNPSTRSTSTRVEGSDSLRPGHTASTATDGTHRPSDDSGSGRGERARGRSRGRGSGRGPGQRPSTSALSINSTSGLPPMSGHNSAQYLTADAPTARSFTDDTGRTDSLSTSSLPPPPSKLIAASSTKHAQQLMRDDTMTGTLTERVTTTSTMSTPKQGSGRGLGGQEPSLPTTAAAGSTPRTWTTTTTSTVGGAAETHRPTPLQGPTRGDKAGGNSSTVLGVVASQRLSESASIPSDSGRFLHGADAAPDRSLDDFSDRPSIASTALPQHPLGSPSQQPHSVSGAGVTSPPSLGVRGPSGVLSRVTSTSGSMTQSESRSSGSLVGTNSRLRMSHSQNTQSTALPGGESGGAGEAGPRLASADVSSLHLAPSYNTSLNLQSNPDASRSPSTFSSPRLSSMSGKRHPSHHLRPKGEALGDDDDNPNLGDVVVEDPDGGDARRGATARHQAVIEETRRRSSAAQPASPAGLVELDADSSRQLSTMTFDSRLSSRGNIALASHVAVHAAGGPAPLGPVSRRSIVHRGSSGGFLPEEAGDRSPSMRTMTRAGTATGTGTPHGSMHGGGATTTTSSAAASYRKDERTGSVRHDASYHSGDANPHTDEGHRNTATFHATESTEHRFTDDDEHGDVLRRSVSPKREAIDRKKDGAGSKLGVPTSGSRLSVPRSGVVAASGVEDDLTARDAATNNSRRMSGWSDDDEFQQWQDDAAAQQKLRAAAGESYKTLPVSSAAAPENHAGKPPRAVSRRRESSPTGASGAAPAASSGATANDGSSNDLPLPLPLRHPPKTMTPPNTDHNDSTGDGGKPATGMNEDSVAESTTWLGVPQIDIGCPTDEAHSDADASATNRDKQSSSLSGQGSGQSKESRPDSKVGASPETLHKTDSQPTLGGAVGSMGAVPTVQVGQENGRGAEPTSSGPARADKVLNAQALSVLPGHGRVGKRVSELSLDALPMEAFTPSQTQPGVASQPPHSHSAAPHAPSTVEPAGRALESGQSNEFFRQDSHTGGPVFVPSTSSPEPALPKNSSMGSLAKVASTTDGSDGFCGLAMRRRQDSTFGDGETGEEDDNTGDDGGEGEGDVVDPSAEHEASPQAIGGHTTNATTTASDPMHSAHPAPQSESRGGSMGGPMEQLPAAVSSPFPFGAEYVLEEPDGQRSMSLPQHDATPTARDLSPPNRRQKKPRSSSKGSSKGSSKRNSPRAGLTEAPPAPPPLVSVAPDGSSGLPAAIANLPSAMDNQQFLSPTQYHGEHRRSYSVPADPRKATNPFISSVAALSSVGSSNRLQPYATNDDGGSAGQHLQRDLGQRRTSSLPAHLAVPGAAWGPGGMLVRQGSHHAGARVVVATKRPSLKSASLASGSSHKGKRSDREHRGKKQRRRSASRQSISVASLDHSGASMGDSRHFHGDGTGATGDMDSGHGDGTPSSLSRLSGTDHGKGRRKDHVHATGADGASQSSAHASQSRLSAFSDHRSSPVAPPVDPSRQSSLAFPAHTFGTRALSLSSHAPETFASNASRGVSHVWSHQGNHDGSRSGAISATGSMQGMHGRSGDGQRSPFTLFGISFSKRPDQSGGVSGGGLTSGQRATPLEIGLSGGGGVDVDGVWRPDDERRQPSVPLITGSLTKDAPAGPSQLAGPTATSRVGSGVGGQRQKGRPAPLLHVNPQPLPLSRPGERRSPVSPIRDDASRLFETSSAGSGTFAPSWSSWLAGTGPPPALPQMLGPADDSLAALAEVPPTGMAPAAGQRHAAAVPKHLQRYIPEFPFCAFHIALSREAAHRHFISMVTFVPCVVLLWLNAATLLPSTPVLISFSVVIAIATLAAVVAFAALKDAVVVRIALAVIAVAFCAALAISISLTDNATCDLTVARASANAALRLVPNCDFGEAQWNNARERLLYLCGAGPVAGVLPLAILSLCGTTRSFLITAVTCGVLILAGSIVTISRNWGTTPSAESVNFAFQLMMNDTSRLSFTTPAVKNPHSWAGLAFDAPLLDYRPCFLAFQLLSLVGAAISAVLLSHWRRKHAVRVAEYDGFGWALGAALESGDVNVVAQVVVAALTGDADEAKGTGASFFGLPRLAPPPASAPSSQSKLHSNVSSPTTKKPRKSKTAGMAPDGLMSPPNHPSLSHTVGPLGGDGGQTSSAGDTVDVRSPTVRVPQTAAAAANTNTMFVLNQLFQKDEHVHQHIHVHQHHHHYPEGEDSSDKQSGLSSKERRRAEKDRERQERRAKRKKEKKAAATASSPLPTPQPAGDADGDISPEERRARSLQLATFDMATTLERTAGGRPKFPESVNHPSDGGVASGKSSSPVGESGRSPVGQGQPSHGSSSGQKAAVHGQQLVGLGISGRQRSMTPPERDVHEVLLDSDLLGPTLDTTNHSKMSTAQSSNQQSGQSSSFPSTDHSPNGAHPGRAFVSAVPSSSTQGTSGNGGAAGPTDVLAQMGARESQRHGSIPSIGSAVRGIRDGSNVGAASSSGQTQPTNATTLDKTTSGKTATTSEQSSPQRSHAHNQQSPVRSRSQRMQRTATVQLLDDERPGYRGHRVNASHPSFGAGSGTVNATASGSGTASRHNISGIAMTHSLSGVSQHSQHQDGSSSLSKSRSQQLQSSSHPSASFSKDEATDSDSESSSSGSDASTTSEDGGQAPVSHGRAPHRARMTHQSGHDEDPKSPTFPAPVDSVLERHGSSRARPARRGPHSFPTGHRPAAQIGFGHAASTFDTTTRAAELPLVTAIARLTQLFAWTNTAATNAQAMLDRTGAGASELGVSNRSGVPPALSSNFPSGDLTHSAALSGGGFLSSGQHSPREGPAVGAGVMGAPLSSSHLLRTQRTLEGQLDTAALQRRGTSQHTLHSARSGGGISFYASTQTKPRGSPSVPPGGAVSLTQAQHLQQQHQLMQYQQQQQQQQQALQQMAEMQRSQQAKQQSRRLSIVSGSAVAAAAAADMRPPGASHVDSATYDWTHTEGAHSPPGDRGMQKDALSDQSRCFSSLPQLASSSKLFTTPQVTHSHFNPSSQAASQADAESRVGSMSFGATTWGATSGLQSSAMFHSTHGSAAHMLPKNPSVLSGSPQVGTASQIASPGNAAPLSPDDAPAIGNGGLSGGQPLGHGGQPPPHPRLRRRSSGADGIAAAATALSTDGSLGAGSPRSALSPSQNPSSDGGPLGRAVAAAGIHNNSTSSGQPSEGRLSGQSAATPIRGGAGGSASGGFRGAGGPLWSEGSLSTYSHTKDSSTGVVVRHVIGGHANASLSQAGASGVNVPALTSSVGHGASSSAAFDGIQATESQATGDRSASDRKTGTDSQSLTKSSGKPSTPSDPHAAPSASTTSRGGATFGLSSAQAPFTPMTPAAVPTGSLTSLSHPAFHTHGSNRGRVTANVPGSANSGVPLAAVPSAGPGTSISSSLALAPMQMTPGASLRSSNPRSPMKGSASPFPADQAARQSHDASTPARTTPGRRVSILDEQMPRPPLAPHPGETVSIRSGGSSGALGASADGPSILGSGGKKVARARAERQSPRHSTSALSSDGTPLEHSPRTPTAASSAGAPMFPGGEGAEQRLPPKKADRSPRRARPSGSRRSEGPPRDLAVAPTPHSAAVLDTATPEVRQHLIALRNAQAMQQAGLTHTPPVLAVNPATVASGSAAVNAIIGAGTSTSGGSLTSTSAIANAMRGGAAPAGGYPPGPASNSLSSQPSGTRSSASAGVNAQGQVTWTPSLHGVPANPNSVPPMPGGSLAGGHAGSESVGMTVDHHRGSQGSLPSGHATSTGGVSEESPFRSAVHFGAVGGFPATGVGSLQHAAAVGGGAAGGGSSLVPWLQDNMSNESVFNGGTGTGTGLPTGPVQPPPLLPPAMHSGGSLGVLPSIPSAGVSTTLLPGIPLAQPNPFAFGTGTGISHATQPSSAAAVPAAMVPASLAQNELSNGPAFLTCFMLPNLAPFAKMAAAREDPAMIQLVADVLTQYYDLVVETVAFYRGTVHFTNGDEVIAGFRDCSSAVAAGVRVKNLVHTDVSVDATAGAGAHGVAPEHAAGQQDAVGRGRSLSLSLKTPAQLGLQPSGQTPLVVGIGGATATTVTAAVAAAPAGNATALTKALSLRRAVRDTAEREREAIVHTNIRAFAVGAASGSREGRFEASQQHPSSRGQSRAVSPAPQEISPPANTFGDGDVLSGTGKTSYLASSYQSGPFTAMASAAKEREKAKDNAAAAATQPHLPLVVVLHGHITHILAPSPLGGATELGWSTARPLLQKIKLFFASEVAAAAANRWAGGGALPTSPSAPVSFGLPSVLSGAPSMTSRSSAAALWRSPEAPTSISAPHFGGAFAELQSVPSQATTSHTHTSRSPPHAHPVDPTTHSQQSRATPSKETVSLNSNAMALPSLVRAPSRSPVASRRGSTLTSASRSSTSAAAAVLHAQAQARRSMTTPPEAHLRGRRGSELFLESGPRGTGHGGSKRASSANTGQHSAREGARGAQAQQAHAQAAFTIGTAVLSHAVQQAVAPSTSLTNTSFGHTQSAGGASRRASHVGEGHLRASTTTQGPSSSTHSSVAAVGAAVARRLSAMGGGVLGPNGSVQAAPKVPSGGPFPGARRVSHETRGQQSTRQSQATQHRLSVQPHSHSQSRELSGEHIRPATPATPQQQQSQAAGGRSTPTTRPQPSAGVAAGALSTPVLHPPLVLLVESLKGLASEDFKTTPMTGFPGLLKVTAALHEDDEGFPVATGATMQQVTGAVEKTYAVPTLDGVLKRLFAPPMAQAGLKPVTGADVAARSGVSPQRATVAAATNARRVIGRAPGQKPIAEALKNFQENTAAVGADVSGVKKSPRLGGRTLAASGSGNMPSGGGAAGAVGGGRHVVSPRDVPRYKAPAMKGVDPARRAAPRSPTANAPPSPTRGSRAVASGGVAVPSPHDARPLGTPRQDSPLSRSRPEMQLPPKVVGSDPTSGVLSSLSASYKGATSPTQPQPLPPPPMLNAVISAATASGVNPGLGLQAPAHHPTSPTNHRENQHDGALVTSGSLLLQGSGHHERRGSMNAQLAASTTAYKAMMAQKREDLRRSSDGVGDLKNSPSKSMSTSHSGPRRFARGSADNSAVLGRSSSASGSGFMHSSRETPNSNRNRRVLAASRSASHSGSGPFSSVSPRTHSLVESPKRSLTVLPTGLSTAPAQLPMNPRPATSAGGGGGGGASHALGRRLQQQQGAVSLMTPVQQPHDPANLPPPLIEPSKPSQSNSGSNHGGGESTSAPPLLRSLANAPSSGHGVGGNTSHNDHSAVIGGGAGPQSAPYQAPFGGLRSELITANSVLPVTKTMLRSTTASTVRSPGSRQPWTPPQNTQPLNLEEVRSTAPLAAPNSVSSPSSVAARPGGLLHLPQLPPAVNVQDQGLGSSGTPGVRSPASTMSQHLGGPLGAGQGLASNSADLLAFTALSQSNENALQSGTAPPGVYPPRSAVPLRQEQDEDTFASPPDAAQLHGPHSTTVSPATGTTVSPMRSAGRHRALQGGSAHGGSSAGGPTVVGVLPGQLRLRRRQSEPDDDTDSRVDRASTVSPSVHLASGGIVRGDNKSYCSLPGANASTARPPSTAKLGSVDDGPHDAVLTAYAPGDLVVDEEGAVFDSAGYVCQQSDLQYDEANGVLLAPQPHHHFDGYTLEEIVAALERVPPVVAEFWGELDTPKPIGLIDGSLLLEAIAEVEPPLPSTTVVQFVAQLADPETETVDVYRFVEAFSEDITSTSDEAIAAEAICGALCERAQERFAPVLRSVWSRHDTGGVGGLEAPEIQRVLTDLGIPRTLCEVELLIERLDVDGNGAVDFDEFAALFHDGRRETGASNALDRVRIVNVITDHLASGECFSTPAQEKRESLLALSRRVTMVITPLLLLYIFYNIGLQPWRAALGGDIWTTRAYLSVLEVVGDVVIFWGWIALKVLLFPREESDGTTVLAFAPKMLLYLKSPELWVDVFIALPLDTIYLAGGPGVDSLSPAVYRLNKLALLYYLPRVFGTCIGWVLRPSVGRIGEIMVWFWVAAHFCACGLILVARNVGQEQLNSTVGTAKVLDDGPTRYLLSILWAMQVMSGQVRGPIMPGEADAIVILMFASVLVGLPLLATLLATIATTLGAETSESRFLAHIDALKSYFSYTTTMNPEIDSTVETDCVEYYRHLYNTTGALDIGSNPLRDVPTELSVRIGIETGLEMLRKVPIFEPVCTNLAFVYEMALKLKPVVIEPGAIVVRKGERGTNMSFVTDGEFRVLGEVAKADAKKHHHHHHTRRRSSAKAAEANKLKRGSAAGGSADAGSRRRSAAAVELEEGELSGRVTMAIPPASFRAFAESTESGTGNPLAGPAAKSRRRRKVRGQRTSHSNLDAATPTEDDKTDDSNPRRGGLRALSAPASSQSRDDDTPTTSSRTKSSSPSTSSTSSSEFSPEKLLQRHLGNVTVEHEYEERRGSGERRQSQLTLMVRAGEVSAGPSMMPGMVGSARPSLVPGMATRTVVAASTAASAAPTTKRKARSSSSGTSHRPSPVGLGPGGFPSSVHPPGHGRAGSMGRGSARTSPRNNAGVHGGSGLHHVVAEESHHDDAPQILHDALPGQIHHSLEVSGSGARQNSRASAGAVPHGIPERGVFGAVAPLARSANVSPRPVTSTDISYAQSHTSATSDVVSAPTGGFGQLNAFVRAKDDSDEFSAERRRLRSSLPFDKFGDDEAGSHVTHDNPTAVASGAAAHHHAKKTDHVVASSHSPEGVTSEYTYGTVTENDADGESDSAVFRTHSHTDEDHVDAAGNPLAGAEAWSPREPGTATRDRPKKKAKKRRAATKVTIDAEPSGSDSDGFLKPNRKRGSHSGSGSFLNAGGSGTPGSAGSAAKHRLSASELMHRRSVGRGGEALPPGFADSSKHVTMPESEYLEKAKVVFVLKKGNFFGEIALLHRIRRTATIVCGPKYANVLQLEKRDFDEVMAMFPDCLSYVSSAAEGRLREILDTEEKENAKAREQRRLSFTNANTRTLTGDNSGFGLSGHGANPGEDGGVVDQPRSGSHQHGSTHRQSGEQEHHYHAEAEANGPYPHNEASAGVGAGGGDPFHPRHGGPWHGAAHIPRPGAPTPFSTDPSTLALLQQQHQQTMGHHGTGIVVEHEDHEAHRPPHEPGDYEEGYDAEEEEVDDGHGAEEDVEEMEDNVVPPVPPLEPPHEPQHDHHDHHERASVSSPRAHVVDQPDHAARSSEPQVSPPGRVVHVPPPRNAAPSLPAMPSPTASPDARPEHLASASAELHQRQPSGGAASPQQTLCSAPTDTEGRSRSSGLSDSRPHGSSTPQSLRQPSSSRGGLHAANPAVLTSRSSSRAPTQSDGEASPGASPGAPSAVESPPSPGAASPEERSPIGSGGRRGRKIAAEPDRAIIEQAIRVFQPHLSVEERERRIEMTHSSSRIDIDPEE